MEAHTASYSFAYILLFVMTCEKKIPLFQSSLCEATSSFDGDLCRLHIIIIVLRPAFTEQIKSNERSVRPDTSMLRYKWNKLHWAIFLYSKT